VGRVAFWKGFGPLDRQKSAFLSALITLFLKDTGGGGKTDREEGLRVDVERPEAKEDAEKVAACAKTVPQGLKPL
jgi:hypothetical protein